MRPTVSARNLVKLHSLLLIHRCRRLNFLFFFSQLPLCDVSVGPDNCKCEPGYGGPTCAIGMQTLHTTFPLFSDPIQFPNRTGFLHQLPLIHFSLPGEQVGTQLQQRLSVPQWSEMRSIKWKLHLHGRLEGTEMRLSLPQKLLRTILFAQVPGT